MEKRFEVKVGTEMRTKWCGDEFGRNVFFLETIVCYVTRKKVMDTYLLSTETGLMRRLMAVLGSSHALAGAAVSARYGSKAKPDSGSLLVRTCERKLPRLHCLRWRLSTRIDGAGCPAFRASGRNGGVLAGSALGT